MLYSLLEARLPVFGVVSECLRSKFYHIKYFSHRTLIFHLVLPDTQFWKFWGMVQLTLECVLLLPSTLSKHPMVSAGAETRPDTLVADSGE